MGEVSLADGAPEAVDGCPSSWTVDYAGIDTEMNFEGFRARQACAATIADASDKAWLLGSHKEPGGTQMCRHDFTCGP